MSAAVSRSRASRKRPSRNADAPHAESTCAAAGRSVDVHRVEHGTERGEAALEMSAREELLGGAPLEIERERLFGPFGCGEERVRRLGAASRPDERLAEPCVERACGTRIEL